jgi:hypothetical protein
MQKGGALRFLLFFIYPRLRYKKYREFPGLRGMLNNQASYTKSHSKGNAAARRRLRRRIIDA